MNVGHTMAVAFSPDAKTLLAGSWDGTVRVLEAATGKEIRQLGKHGGYVDRVVFSSDGKIVVSNGYDGTTHAWDAASGDQLRVWQGPIHRISVSANGRLVAGNKARSLYLWEVKTGKILWQVANSDALGFTSHSSKIICRSYLDPNRDVSWDIVVRDAATAKRVAHFPTAQLGRFPFRALSPNSQKLLFSGGPSLVLFDLATGRMRTAAKPVHDVSVFSGNAKMFAFADSDAIVHVWETASLQERCRFRGHEKRYVPLAFSADGTVLASGSTDSTVLLWDVPGMRTGRIGTGKLTANEPETLWTDLASADAARAYRAMGRMWANTETSLAFLKERLPPAAMKIDPARVDRLIGDLDSGKFPVRDKAARELEKLGELAEARLRQALARKPTLEVRRRLDKLVERIEEERFNPAPGRLRIMRAVEVVESIASRQAKALLDSWAKGTPGMSLTREAQQALENLTNRGDCQTSTN